MSNGEKKNNLADLLEEYFPGAGKKAERILNEVFADYEPEKRDISEEIIDGEGLEEFEDAPDVPDEPFEVPEETEEDGEEVPEKTAEELSTLSQWSDWAEGAIAANAAASETFDGTEKDNADSTDETEEEESTDEAESTDEKEGTDETDEAEDVPQEKITENEDINEVWIKRFAKGIFPVKGDSVFEVVRKIIFLAAVVVFIGAGVMLASTLIQSRKAVEVQSEARSLIETTVATTIDEDGNVVTIPPTKEEQEQHNKEVAKSFKEINEDYIGYLEIAGCEIFEPVVKGRDIEDDFYLKHNIYGEENKAGTLYMDSRCTVTPEYTSPNIVIYGHNQEDGTMFGHLKYYKVDYTLETPNTNFYQYNPVIKFNPEFENGEYLIYAFFVTNALESQDRNGEVFHYHDYIETMNDESTFNWYLGEVQERNQIISPVDVKYGDKLLVLSTCSNEFTQSRFVVFARKLRDGESVSDYDFSETRLNPNARGVDWGVIIGEDTETTVPETEEELEETTTRKKSLNKRNEKTYTTATEEETEETAVTEPAVPADATVTTVPESETEVTETETAGSTETEESGTETDENGESAPETDENGETVTYPDSTAGDTGETDTETTSKKKSKETSETVTSKKKSKKSNK